MFLGDVWEVLGRFEGSFWEVLGEILGGMFGVFSKEFGEVLGRFLEGKTFKQPIIKHTKDLFKPIQSY